SSQNKSGGRRRSTSTSSSFCVVYVYLVISKMAATGGGSGEERPPTYPWYKDKVLGTGGFGTVTLWRHNDTGETIALKKCRWGTPGTGTENILTPKHVERWEKEVEIMNRLTHNAVVR
ncbi:unnamed protein product, partial [Meganyctiphanes norvegica]